MKRRRNPFRGVDRAVALSHKVKYFTDTFMGNQLTVTPANLSGQFKVNLNQSSNYAGYLQLFDQFTIVKFHVALIPATPTAVYGTSPPTALMTTRINRNGQSGPPTSLMDMMGGDRSKTIQLDGSRIIHFTVKDPKPYLTQLDNTGTDVLIQQPLKKWVWLDLINGAETNFYGIDYYIDGLGSGSVVNCIYDVIITATYAFKDQQ